MMMYEVEVQIPNDFIESYLIDESNVKQLFITYDVDHKIHDVCSNLMMELEGIWINPITGKENELWNGATYTITLYENKLNDFIRSICEYTPIVMVSYLHNRKHQKWVQTDDINRRYTHMRIDTRNVLPDEDEEGDDDDTHPDYEYHAPTESVRLVDDYTQTYTSVGGVNEYDDLGESESGSEGSKHFDGYDTFYSIEMRKVTHRNVVVYENTHYFGVLSDEYEFKNPLTIVETECKLTCLRAENSFVNRFPIILGTQY